MSIITCVCPFWRSLTIFSDLPFVAVCCDFPSTAKLGYSTPRWTTYRTGSVGLAAALLRFLPASEQRRRRRRAAPAERLAADGEPCSVSLSLCRRAQRAAVSVGVGPETEEETSSCFFFVSVIDRVLLSFKCRVSKIGATRLLPREKRSQSAKSPFKSVRSRSSLIPF